MTHRRSATTPSSDDDTIAFRRPPLRPGRCVVALAAATVALAAAVTAVPARAIAPPPGGAAEPPAGGAEEEAPPTKATDASGDDADDADDAPPRVAIVVVDERERVGGTIQLESDEVIVLRTPEGRMRSFAKDGVRRVDHLLGRAPGRRGTVVLRSGETHAGLILLDDLEKVQLEIGGVAVDFERRRVDRLVLEPTVRERYEHYRALLDRDDVEAHYDLCRWLADEREWTLAAAELERLLGRMDHRRARDLQRIVLAQLDLARERAERAAEGGVAEESDSGDRRDPDARGPLRLLNEREVDLIRVYEIDFRRPPRVDVPRAVVDVLLDRYGDAEVIPDDPVDRDRLHRAPSIEIVRLMFQLRARELYDEIRVRTEPAALDLFRRRVHDAWLIRNCGACHDGDHVGPFRLVTFRPRRTEARYTNLLLLERTEVPEGRLVDYDDPTSSLILQYALPRARARVPHPPVGEFRPVFTGPNDDRLLAAVGWIESMYRPRPEYPVELDPEDVFGPVPEQGDPSATGEGRPAEGGRQGR